MAAPTRRTAEPKRPIAVTVLGVLQFVVAAAFVIVMLGDGTLDGELSALDIGKAVGAALVGAAIVGATWSGGRIGWYAQLVLAASSIVWGGVTLATDRAPGAPMLVVGVLWLGLALLPPSRDYYLRDV